MHPQCMILAAYCLHMPGSKVVCDSPGQVISGHTTAKRVLVKEWDASELYYSKGEARTVIAPRVL